MGKGSRLLFRTLGMGLAFASTFAVAGVGAGASLVRTLPDGAAYVRVENAPGLMLAAACVRRLDAGLRGRTEAGAVEAAVADVACSCAPGDRPMAAAIAAYAFTVVEEALAPAVLAGASACSADDTATAAGPSARPAMNWGSFLPGGIGRGIREPCGNSSPITLC